MPVNLEMRIKNLDDVFREQWNMFDEASKYITKALTHEYFGPWQHISNILAACQSRNKIITGDYLRADSYESMRIINTRMTDVLNAIIPVRDFMAFAIEQYEKQKEEARLNAERLKQLEEARLKELGPIAVLQKVVDGLDELKIVTVNEKPVVPAGPVEEAPASAPLETNLLLNEQAEKPNAYEEPPRRGRSFFKCFGRR
ncbi:hypothetical protein B9Z55_023363 [Caenorhabditis nigoni]|nr:hypothetical protein B9Z55_023363 [Caenorhabditis nigoni]